MPLQGLRVATTLMALVLALFTMNALGLSALVGIAPASGGMQKATVNDTTAEIADAEFEGVGQQDPGFFGIATAMARTFGQLWSLITASSAILQSYGVPWPIATSVQIMVDFTFAFALYQIARGVSF